MKRLICWCFAFFTCLYVCVDAYASGFPSLYSKLNYKDYFSYETLLKNNIETPNVGASLAYDGGGGGVMVYVPGGTIRTDIKIASSSYEDGSVTYWVGTTRPSVDIGDFYSGSSYREKTFLHARLLNIRLPGPDLKSLDATKGYWVNFAISGFNKYSVEQYYTLNLNDTSDGQHTYGQWYESVGNNWQANGDPPLDEQGPPPEPAELKVDVFTYTVDITNPSVLSFNLEASGGVKPYTYKWSFPDGSFEFLNSTNVSQNPKVKFLNDTVNVEVTVTDSAGNSIFGSIDDGVIIQPGNSGDQALIDIKKVNCAVPDIYSPFQVRLMPMIEISGIESGDLEYKWTSYQDTTPLTFTGETTSSSSSPVVSFPGGGNYSVKLDVKSSSNPDISASKTFYVPLAQMSVERSQVNLTKDKIATIKVSNAIGLVEAEVSDESVAKVVVDGALITITGISDGYTRITVKDEISQQFVFVMVGEDDPRSLPKSAVFVEYTSDNKSLAPVYLGSITSGGDEFELIVNFPPYSESVDHYVAFVLPDGTFYYVADNDQKPLSTDVTRFSRNQTQERIFKNVFPKDYACDLINGTPSYLAGTWTVYWLTCPTSKTLLEGLSDKKLGYEGGYYSFDFSCPFK